MRAALVTLLLSCSLGGCPRTVEDPGRSPEAEACVSDAQCQPDGGPACGTLRVCVDGLCEATPSRTRFCR